MSDNQEVESVRTMSHSMMQHFAYTHLSDDLQEISKKFCDLANEMNELLDEGDMKTIVLFRLLEAKDCAVRQRHVDINNHKRDERLTQITDILYPNPKNDKIITH